MKMMVLAAVGLIALAGCSGGEHKEQVLANTTEDANVVMTPANEITPTPPVNVAEAPTPEVPQHITDDEQQIRDDADASGLTARLQDGESGSDTANQTQPVEK